MANRRSFGVRRASGGLRQDLAVPTLELGLTELLPQRARGDFGPGFIEVVPCV